MSKKFVFLPKCSVNPDFTWSLAPNSEHFTECEVLDVSEALVRDHLLHKDLFANSESQGILVRILIHSHTFKK